MNKLTNLPKIIRSSENSNNVSLTLKGMIVLAVIFLFRQVDNPINENEAVIIAELIISLVGVAVTLFGAVRRLKNN